MEVICIPDECTFSKAALLKPSTSLSDDNNNSGNCTGKTIDLFEKSYLNFDYLSIKKSSSVIISGISQIFKMT